MDFDEARQTVQQHLDEAFGDEPESPKVRGYGFDTGDAWAPLVDWAGVMGIYLYLVDKTSGALTPLSFPEFDELPDLPRVGTWPTNRLSTLVNRGRDRHETGSDNG